MNTWTKNGIIKLEEDGKTTVVKDLVFESEEVHTLLQATDEKTRAETLTDAIKIGIKGLKQMRIGGELNYIENGFNQMMAKFNLALDPTLPNSFFYRFVRLIQEYYDRGGRVEHLLDPSTVNGPLNKLQCEIRGEIQKLRDIIIKKETETAITNTTPLKGMIFEDFCENVLADFVSASVGDDLQRTTKICGLLTGSFAGDFLLTLQGTSDKKITIETKDIENISEPCIIKNLKLAMQNRQARYGIFVIKYKEGLPRKFGWFHELSDNMLVCAMGNKNSDTFFPQVMLLAIQWAKMKLQKDIGIDEKALETIFDGINQIGKKLDRFTLIQTKCTNIEKATSEIRELATLIKDEIGEQVAKMKRVIFSLSADTTGGEK